MPPTPQYSPLKCYLFKGLLVLLVFSFWTAEAQPLQPASEAYLMDLRKVNLDQKDTTLNGTWAFFWQEYRTDFKSGQNKMGIVLPGFWADQLRNGQKLPERGFATYQLTILLPSGRKGLGLKIPFVNSSYKLYAGDSLLYSDGSPGTTANNTIPHYSTRIIPIQGDTLRLSLQIANFHHSRGGGMLKPIQIGSLQALQHANTLNTAMDWFLTGIVFIMGLLFLGLYLFSRGDKPLLFFALFCMLYSYRIVGTSAYELHDVLPNLSWAWSIHLEYLSLFLSVPMFMLYTRYLFPKDAPQKLLLIVSSFSFAFAGITLVSPPLFFTRIVDIYLVFFISSITLAFFIYYKANYHNRVGAKIALISTSSICILAVLLTLEYYGLVTLSKPITFLSYLGFFVCQSLVLPFRFAYILHKANEKAILGLKAKNEFVSTMSHEIRTPLNSVIGMAHIMQSEKPREDQKSHLEILLFSANNLLGIVNNILDLNKIEAGHLNLHLEPVDLDSISNKVMLGIKAASSNQNVEYIQNTHSVANLPVLADGQKFAQILVNLLGNASKFTQKGQICCDIALQERHETSITLRISVRDTGIGIPIEKQAMIFERFTQVESTYTRNFEGAGLGLAITKQMLELQGVQLQLDSVYGLGSEFFWTQTFELAKGAIPVTEELNEALLPMAGIRILIVEDINMNILVLQKFLGKWGATYDVATNGQDAVDKFSLFEYDLVLMDLHMPVMDGYQATKILRAQGITLPIIALTADVGSNKEIELAGMNDLLLKPYNPKILLQVLQRHLQYRPLERNGEI